MNVTIIAAVGINLVIGANGGLPWGHIPEDMKRFRELTMGHTVIMGRKTYDSIGKPLKGRHNVVITRNPRKVTPQDGIWLVGSLNEALRLAKLFGDKRPFIIGGAEIYQQAMPIANSMEITFVLREVEGDTYFPEITDRYQPVGGMLAAPDVVFARYVAQHQEPKSPVT